MAGPIGQPIPTPGFIATEATPDALALYVTVDDLTSLYGLCVEEGEIRAAMAIIHAHTNRTSLWPERYLHTIDIADGYNTGQLFARPVIELLSMRGRYGAQRRDRRATLSYGGDYFTTAALLMTGTGWQDIDVSSVQLDGAAGLLTLPTGFMPLWYTQVQVEYLAGLPRIPDRVKLAVAEIINTIRQRGASDRNFYAAGKIQTSWAGTGYLSTEARRLLAPYVIQALF